MSTERTIKFLSLKSQQEALLEALSKTFSDVLHESHYILGHRVQAFEREFAAYTQTKFCIGVGSGLDALTIALRSLALRTGDEVIVPANTYVATWLAISNCGGAIIPAEPNPDTFNLDPERVRELITDRTRVILPVHLYGQPCDMTQLLEIARTRNIHLLEDNAQAHGASWAGHKTGSWGDVNATSFYPTKNLGALGDGGAITTSDERFANFARSFRNYGSAKKNFVEMHGINSRLDELQAAFLSLKLKHLDEWNEQRRKLAHRYNERLKSVAEVQLPYCAPEAHHVYHLYVIKCEQRDRLMRHLAKHNIETMVHYPVAPHQQKAYGNTIQGKFPITEKLASTVLSLPLWPGMPINDVDYISEKIAEFYR